MERLLIVDDDAELCELVAQYLEREGFAVEAAHDGERGLQRALSGEHALLVLDVMLPGVSGLDLLRRLRSRSQLPVLILTARGEDVDRVVGLEIGADDYLPKPFNPRELVARVRAVLRRARGEAPGAFRGKIQIGDVELDAGARTVHRGRHPVTLTAVEFRILETLMRSAGQVVSREQLVTHVLERRFLPYDRSIDVHVSKLRRKLGEPAGDECIKTIRGVGYVYAQPSAPGGN